MKNLVLFIFAVLMSASAFGRVKCSWIRKYPQKDELREAVSAQMPHKIAMPLFSNWNEGNSRELIRIYVTEEHYPYINGGLRNGNQKEDFYKFVDLIVSALCDVKEFQGTVYRGSKETTEYKTGDIVTYKAFTSTSKKMKIACRFAGRETLFKIKSKFGRDISEFSHAKWEEEILFAPNTNFKVLNIIPYPSDDDVSCKVNRLIELEEI